MTHTLGSASPLALAAALLVAGAILALVLPRPARPVAAILTQLMATVIVLGAIAPVLTTGAVLEAAMRWSFPVQRVVLRVDPLSAFFLSWSLPMTLIGTVYGTSYLEPSVRKGRNAGPHFALLNLTALAFVVVYSVQNALAFLLGWEIAAVAAWLLVIWDYTNQKVRFAGFNYLVSTHVGLFVLVAAFMLLYAKTGSMEFDSFRAILVQRGGTRAAAFLLLGASFALKAAFFPFHTWLPRAHAAAPAHVSALMSGVIHKAGLFAFLRFTLLLGRPEEWMGWGVLGFGAVSAFFGVLYTAVQRDLKRLLGYSSTENVGIAAIGFGVGYLGLAWDQPALAALGFGGGLLHVFNHALFKCLLFYAAGAVYRQAHTVDLERLGGVLRRMPRTGVLFLIGALSIAALPPLNGFVSEFAIYRALFSGLAPSPTTAIGLVCVAAALAFAGAVSCLSIVRAFGIAFLGSPRDPSVQPAGEVPGAMWGPMALHAAACLAIGTLPTLGLRLIRTATAQFDARAVGAISIALGPVQSATATFSLVVLLGGAIGWWSGRHARRHVTWGCGYTAGNPRMQYTASSFSAQFAAIFEGFLPHRRRGRLPTEIFPAESSHLSTHHYDAVEQRMFEVLGQGEEMISNASQRIPEQPRFAFAAGLITLAILVGLILRGSP